MSSQDTRSALKYFPGPLAFVEPKNDNEAVMVVDAKGGAVAMLYWPGHPVDETAAAEQETYALGRAMAAAPSLVAALEDAIDTIKSWHNIGGCADIWPIYFANAPEMKRLTAALKAAKGQP